MKKHAYLIMAHHQMELLKILIECLDYELHDIYIHIDKKWGFENSEALCSVAKKSKVFLLNRRISVKWGRYSVIQCELALLKEASRNHYEYYHLLSGVTLPLKKPEYIHSFFSSKSGMEFIHFDSSEIDKTVYDRVAKFHFFVNRTNGKAMKRINRLIMMPQKLIDRGKKYHVKFQKGSNWFSITDELAQYVIKKEKTVKKMFRFSCCGDEMFLQTLVANSEFIERVCPNNFLDSYATIQYCIDWKRGRPYIFKESDYNALMESGMCFARKFDLNVDAIIVEKIRNSVLLSEQ